LDRVSASRPINADYVLVLGAVSALVGTAQEHAPALVAALVANPLLPWAFGAAALGLAILSRRPPQACA
jgi:hypothetical protein